tara:strand:- start:76 stop:357 length:282 start_codon:yes stop_codon:yes gene_type:complete
MEQLISWLVGNNIVISKTKKANGFMIYNTESVTDLAKLTSLCNSVGFKVINSPAKFDASTGKPIPASIYCGIVKSNLDLSDESAMADYLNSIK